MGNLIEGIQSEMNRVRELRGEYARIPTGMFGMAVIDAAIKQGETAIASGDVIEMLKAYKELESITG